MIPKILGEGLYMEGEEEKEKKKKMPMVIFQILMWVRE